MRLSAFFTAKTNNLSSQFFRYFLVGGLAFIVDFTLLFLLTEFGHLYYLLSASIAFVAGVTVNYALSISWVFSYRSVENRMQEFAMFTIIGIIGLVMNDALMWVFTELLGLHYLGSKAVAAALIFVFNFAARRVLLFSGKHPREGKTLQEETSGIPKPSIFP